MSRLNTTNPVYAGRVFASYNASSVNNTDWNTLSSSDFYDTQTGVVLAASREFAFIKVISGNTTTLSFFKARAAAGAGDGVANSDGVIPVSSEISVDISALGAVTTSIAYKKAAGGDQFVILAGFN